MSPVALPRHVDVERVPGVPVGVHVGARAVDRGRERLEDHGVTPVPWSPPDMAFEALKAAKEAVRAEAEASKVLRSAGNGDSDSSDFDLSDLPVLKATGEELTMLAQMWKSRIEERVRAQDQTGPVLVHRCFKCFHPDLGFVHKKNPDKPSRRFARKRTQQRNGGRVDNWVLAQMLGKTCTPEDLAKLQKLRHSPNANAYDWANVLGDGQHMMVTMHYACDNPSCGLIPIEKKGWWRTPSTDCSA